MNFLTSKKSNRGVLARWRLLCGSAWGALISAASWQKWSYDSIRYTWAGYAQDDRPISHMLHYLLEPYYNRHQSFRHLAWSKKENSAALICLLFQISLYIFMWLKSQAENDCLIIIIVHGTHGCQNNWSPLFQACKIKSPLHTLPPQ